MIKRRKVLKIGSYTPYVSYVIVETTFWGRKPPREDTYVAKTLDAKNFLPIPNPTWFKEEDLKPVSPRLRWFLDCAHSKEQTRLEFKQAKDEFIRRCTQKLETPFTSDSTGQYTTYTHPYTNTPYTNNNTANLNTANLHPLLFSPPY